MAVYSSFQKDDCQDYVCETIGTYFLGVMARLSKMLINPILFQILLLDVMGQIILGTVAQKQTHVDCMRVTVYIMKIVLVTFLNMSICVIQ